MIPRNAALLRGMSAHLLESVLYTELAGTGITLRQVLVLASLALHGPLVQALLAEMMCIEPSTLITRIDRMERDGTAAPCTSKPPTPTTITTCLRSRAASRARATCRSVGHDAVDLCLVCRAAALAC